MSEITGVVLPERIPRSTHEHNPELQQHIQQLEAEIQHLMSMVYTLKSDDTPLHYHIPLVYFQTQLSQIDSLQKLDLIRSRVSIVRRALACHIDISLQRTYSSELISFSTIQYTLPNGELQTPTVVPRPIVGTRIKFTHDINMMLLGIEDGEGDDMILLVNIDGAKVRDINFASQKRAQVNGFNETYARSSGDIFMAIYNASLQRAAGIVTTQLQQELRDTSIRVSVYRIGGDENKLMVKLPAEFARNRQNVERVSQNLLDIALESMSKFSSEDSKGRRQVFHAKIDDITLLDPTGDELDDQLQVDMVRTIGSPLTQQEVETYKHDTTMQRTVDSFIKKKDTMRIQIENLRDAQNAIQFRNAFISLFRDNSVYLEIYKHFFGSVTEEELFKEMKEVFVDYMVATLYTPTFEPALSYAEAQELYERHDEVGIILTYNPIKVFNKLSYQSGEQTIMMNPLEIVKNVIATCCTFFNVPHPRFDNITLTNWRVHMPSEVFEAVSMRFINNGLDIGMIVHPVENADPKKAKKVIRFLKQMKGFMSDEVYSEQTLIHTIPLVFTTQSHHDKSFREVISESENYAKQRLWDRYAIQIFFMKPDMFSQFIELIQSPEYRIHDDSLIDNIYQFAAQFQSWNNRAQENIEGLYMALGRLIQSFPSEGNAHKIVTMMGQLHGIMQERYSITLTTKVNSSYTGLTKQ